MDFNQILYRTLFFGCSALIMFFAIIAVIRGRRNMKMIKHFETADKKVKAGYWTASLVHMLAGITIIVCLVVVGAVFIFILRLGTNLGGE